MGSVKRAARHSIDAEVNDHSTLHAIELCPSQTHGH